MTFPSISKYLHNPYQESYLVFSIHPWNTSNDSYHQDANSSDTSIWSMNLISIIEIGTQTIHPAISLALILPIQFLFTTSAIYIQLRTLDMLKKENSVNNPLMVTQARIHIIFWPSIVIVNTLTDNIYPLSAVLTSSFCTVLSLYFYFCTFSMILYSFYAAFLRYVCCCYTENVNNFGKGKVISLVYWTFYLHTFGWALYTIVTQYNLDHVPLLNSCYGYKDRIFLMESSPLNMARRHLCLLESVNGRSSNIKLTLNIRYKSLLKPNSCNIYLSSSKYTYFRRPTNSQNCSLCHEYAGSNYCCVQPTRIFLLSGHIQI